MTSRKKPLHVAKNMDELKLKQFVNQPTINKSSQVIQHAIKHLLSTAENHYANHDEEAAYLTYMRYADLAMAVKNVNRDDLKRAISRCEELKVSLEKRYAERELEASLENVPLPPAMVSPKPRLTNGSIHALIEPKSTTIPPPSMKPKEPQPSTGPVRSTMNGLLNETSVKPGIASDGYDDDSYAVDNRLIQPINEPHSEQKGTQFVSAKELRTLLLESKALVIDCRSAEAFEDSRISISSNVINIPKLYMGITCSSIENELIGRAKELFGRRKNFDKVVIVDWDGRGYLSPGAPAACLYEALWKWAYPATGITCWFLKEGYRFWIASYPHDTTNSKPREEFNKVTEVPGGLEGAHRSLARSIGGSLGVNHSSKTSAPSAEEVHDLTWLPQAFETKVQVVQTSTITPTVTPSAPPNIAQTTSTGPSTTANPGWAVAAGGEPAKVLGSRPTPSAPPAVSAGGDVRHDGGAGSELGRVDRSSQNIVRQFTQSVNEQVSTTKPRTRSEAADRAVPVFQPSFSKPQLLRSRSLSDISEESRIPFVGDVHHPAEPTARDQASSKRPLIDRSVKPSNSLDAATVHRPKDGQYPNYATGPIQSSGGTLSLASYPTADRLPNGGPVNNNGPIVRNVFSINDASKRMLGADRPGSRQATKPRLPPKNRSESPVQVYGTSERTSGLRNLGNSCYMNSVLQALAHSTEFARFFVGRRYEDHLNTSNPRGSRGLLPKCFAQLLSQLWSQNDTRDPLMEFRNLMGSLYPMYAKYEQQDSHEFLVNLLDRLHEDLNRAKLRNRPNSSNNTDTVVTFPMLASELEKFFLAHNDMQFSVVTQNYEGILVSGLKCNTCENDSYTFQVFNVLSVPIPSRSGVDILHCFDEFFREETVDEWMCPHCKAKRTAKKHMRVARLPKHLIIHLVRFKNESWTSFSSYKKITTNVDFTVVLDTRDLAQYMYSKEVKLKSYTLYAIVNHYGTISNGHYYSDCRFLPQTQWYRYSDLQVTAVQGEKPDGGSAYMLFYSCVD